MWAICWRVEFDDKTHACASPSGSSTHMRRFRYGARYTNATSRIRSPRRSTWRQESPSPSSRRSLDVRRASAAAVETQRHRHPRRMTSKSPAVRLLNAGFSSELFQRASIAPVTYMSLPLSATIRP